jgi:sialic acid synthase SpsE
MATLDEVREAVKHLDQIENLYLLQCTSQYPTDDENVNLRAMVTLKREFSDHRVGFSDHSHGIDACLAAVALGAEVLEKHFTFHTAMPGDDHAGAMTPEMLKQLRIRAERIERMLGSDRKEPVPAEERAREHLRVRMREVPYR